MEYRPTIALAGTVVLPNKIAWTVTRLRIARTVIGTAEPCGEDELIAQVVADLTAAIERLEARLAPGAV